MKQVKFEIFGKGQYLFFNISRLIQLEKAVGNGIGAIVSKKDLSLDVLTKALSIGLAQHQKRNEMWYADKIQACLDDGAELDQDFYVPLVKAIAGSGILGKAAYYGAFPEEMTDKAKTEVDDEVKND
jgi:hypothetical protein